MTSKEFVLWLKGFTDGVHEFNITPKQWDILKDKLAEVDDNTIPMGGVIVDHNTFRVPNTAPIQTLPFIQPYNPYNPYQINCGSGSSGTITTTPNVGGSITIANPPFGFGSTSTTYAYPSGSAWHYTNGKPHNED
jgi:hypothetical protein